MTTRYVGPGGLDTNSGLTWALRKLTLNGVEDTPVVAGDLVIVGPGTYREQLQCDIDGSSGLNIHYQGDPSGKLTDGIGGKVLITGMADDSDDLPVRNYCVYSTGDDFREFSYLEFGPGLIRSIYSNSEWLHVHDCIFTHSYDDGTLDLGGIYIFLISGRSFIVERCIFDNAFGSAVFCEGTSANGGGTRKIENCIATNRNTASSLDAILRSEYCGDIYIRNCTLYHCGSAVSARDNTATYPVYVYNCQLEHCYFGFYAITLGEIIEDYNSLFQNDAGNERTNVATGANSIVSALLPVGPTLFNGIKIAPLSLTAPSQYSQMKTRTDDGNGPSDDIWGIARPSVNGKRSWGAIQHDVVERDITTTYLSSPASLKMIDAGSKQFTVPVFNSPVAVSVRAYREADYAGTLPQVIIREAGQTARTTTDTGSAQVWNLLTDEFTPAVGIEYITVELRSNNSATSGDYAAFFDAFEVTIEQ